MGSKVDMHVHTKHSDGISSGEAIARAAQAAGLDVVCLTDHHSNRGDEVDVAVYALRRAGVLPVVAVEYSTAQGHLLIYGIDVPPDCAWGMYPDMQALVDEVNAMGGVCVAPHPHKGYARVLRDGVERVTGLTAVEVLNGQCEQREPGTNTRARESAQRMGARMVAGSDAHVAADVGCVYTRFPGRITSEGGFLAALRAGKFSPARNERILKARRPRPAPAVALAHPAPARPLQGGLWGDLHAWDDYAGRHDV